MYWLQSYSLQKQQQCKTYIYGRPKTHAWALHAGDWGIQPVFTKTHSVNFGCRPQTDNLFDSSQKNGEKAFPCSANGPVETAICQRQLIRSKGDFYCPFY